MDPLSLTASLIAIGTAATTALQISTSLYDLARAYKSAAEEIENFALDLRSFASVVQLGQDSLERHRKKAPFSEVIRYIESLDVLNQLASQSKRTTKSIERVWQQTRSLQSDNLLTKVKWMAKKGEVRGLKPDMESLKSSLHLVMAAITMEALQQSSSEDLQEEIKSLKQQIQMQLETIKFLQESQERQRAEFGDSESRPVSLLDPDAQKALVGLGESMVKNGTVPDVGYRGRSASRSSWETLQPPTRFDPPKPVEPALEDAQIISSNSIKASKYVSGLISGSRGKEVSVRAGLARYLPFNIVSEKLANDIGSTVTEPEVSNVWIDFGGARVEKSIGETELTWSRVNIRCLIFRGAVLDLTLGEGCKAEFEDEWNLFS